jgi:plasmid stability protein
MATLTIRKLNDDIKTGLRLRAAAHGQSMEEEVRQILKRAVQSPSGGDKVLGTRIRNRFAALGGVELPLPKRKVSRRSPGFSDAQCQ